MVSIFLHTQKNYARKIWSKLNSSVCKPKTERNDEKTIKQRKYINFVREKKKQYERKRFVLIQSKSVAKKSPRNKKYKWKVKRNSLCVLNYKGKRHTAFSDLAVHKRYGDHFFFNVEKFVEYFIECFIYFFVVVAVYSLSCLQSQRLSLPQLYVMTAKASA